MDKILSIDTKFLWKILEDKHGGYVAVCDRLQVTTQADNYDELGIAIQDVMSLLFKDIYEEKEWAKYAWDHSLEFKVSDFEDFMMVQPTPIILEEKEIED